MANRRYLIYLRKSRADLDAEQRGEGETLARHERALTELAGRLNLHVAAIYREIVSGETIAARPVMQRLLSEVESGLWAGVLVMEVERLARGDTIDQGIVAQTFQFSGTKILTPAKTYDPENEFDEEYFEFGLFMSRREYKAINRRLQRGRAASIREGKFVGSVPPYGYDRVKLERDKGFSLVPNPEQAGVVRMIYALYTRGEMGPDGAYRRLGLSKIARRLNAMGILAKHNGPWTPAAVRDLMKNPVYIGKLRWQWRKVVKRRQNGRLVTARPRNDAVPLYDGLHEPLVDQETFRLAQENLSSSAAPAIRERGVTQNPLAGLVVCGSCGKRMQRRPYLKSGRRDSLLCPCTSCDTVSSDLALVERRILEALGQWLKDCRVPWESAGRAEDDSLSVQRQAVRKLEADIAALEKQRDHLHDLLEQGVYDADTFRARSGTLASRLQQARSALLNLERTPRRQESPATPEADGLLDVYQALPTPAAKNDLLKEVLEKAVYTKERGGRWGAPDAFQIDLYPKLPRAAGPSSPTCRHGRTGPSGDGGDHRPPADPEPDGGADPDRRL